MPATLPNEPVTARASARPTSVLSSDLSQGRRHAWRSIGRHPARYGLAAKTGVTPWSRCDPQIGFRCFMSMTAAMTSRLGPLGPGSVGRLGEKSRRYFRWISARCRRNSVDGSKTIGERMNRPGRIKSAHRPTTTRSEGRRFGDRFRDRLRISSWCLTSTDSATTERAPPGPARRVTAASRCRKDGQIAHRTMLPSSRHWRRMLRNFEFAKHRPGAHERPCGLPLCGESQRNA